MGKEITKILDRFFVQYDKRVRPNYGGECTCLCVRVL